MKSSVESYATPETSIDSLMDDHPAQSFSDYDHVTWYVSNAKQVSSYFCARFGFREIAYRGLETGSKDIASHVVQLGATVMVFTSALRARASLPQNTALVQEIHDHVTSHGDAVKDVAFACEDVDGVFQAALQGGAQMVYGPHVHSDKLGKVHTATIKALGDVTHTFINRTSYKASFLPGFSEPLTMQPYIDTLLGDTGIHRLDHCVSNQGWNEMDEACKFYEQALGFHKFWSVDDKQVCTEFSALRSTVMASRNNRIKMPVNEPAEGVRRSQVEEFVDFNNGPGIQHLAFQTDNIIETITNLRQRGVDFIKIPRTYYDILHEHLSHSTVNIREDLQVLQDLDILVDFDDNGYLLQLFSKPLSDRPTVFIEIIQRENFDGFGAGNFKSLFESIEQDQSLRGTL